MKLRQRKFVLKLRHRRRQAQIKLQNTDTDMAVFFSGRETACFEIQSTLLSFKVDDKNLIQLSRQGHLM